MFSSIQLDDASERGVLEAKDTVTYGGISLKTVLLLALTVISGALCMSGIIPTNLVFGLLMGSVFGGVLFVLLGTLVPGAAMVCAILYSICEGAFLGLLSALFELEYPGIVSGAVICAVVVFGVMLFLYSMGIVRVGGKFRRFMLIAGISLMVFYGIMGVGVAFGWTIALEFSGTGPLGLLLTIFLVLYGAFMLLFDFDRATFYVDSQAPKKYEWTCAFALMLDVIYIYIEVLRLLAIIASRAKDN